MLLTKRLTNENPIIFHSNKERIISITTISLESAEEKFPIDIFCENKRKKEKYKICSLKKGFQETYSTSITLDLHNFKDKYEFTLNTKCKKASVNIIGFFEEEEDEEQEANDKHEKEQIKEKEKVVEKKNKNMEEKSESDSDSNDNDDLNIEEEKPNVSLVELLNKKRKEEPQEIKPVTLKNLIKDENKKDNEIKKEKLVKKENIEKKDKNEKQENKNKIKDKNIEKKLIKKDKKLINK